MADVFSKQKRSEVMSMIKGKGNRSTELRLIEILREHKIRGWRRNYPLTGRPDFAFPLQKTVVFVDGCFWHSCPKCSNIPKQNRKFWLCKLERTRKRDFFVTKQLKEADWKVLRLWEHQLYESDRVAAKIRKLIDSKL